MTAHATHARVITGLVSCELRLHHRVTGFAAEVHRLGVFIAAITAEGAGGHKQKCNRQKDKERLSRSWIVQIQSGIRCVIARRRAMTTPALDDSAGDDDDQTK